jgi:hypothetical protein
LRKGQVSKEYRRKRRIFFTRDNFMKKQKEWSRDWEHFDWEQIRENLHEVERKRQAGGGGGQGRGRNIP